MTKFITILKLLVELLPTIVSIIKQIEALIPQSGQGATKLAMTRELIEGAYKQATDISVSFDEVWPAIQRTITSLVATYNSLGIFKK